MNNIMIKTDRLTLRPITIADAQTMFEYCQDPHVGPHAGWKPHANIQETQEVITSLFLNKENIFGIELNESQKLIGTIGLLPDPKRQNFRAQMLGYSISRKHWSNGYTTEAAMAVIHHGFNNSNLELISAYCYPYNIQSKRVLEKCGLQYEGTLHLCERRYDDVLLDNLCYAMTKSGFETHTESGIMTVFC